MKVMSAKKDLHVDCEVRCKGANPL